MPTRVLVVEDEEDVASLVADVLDLEGFEARIASGASALQEARDFQPDVILLDLMMPEVDGFQAAQLLHAEAATRDIPIVVMTAMHDAPGKAREVGAADVLAKPFDIADLIKVIERARRA